MKKRFVVLGVLLLCLGGKAQDAYVPSPENLEARKEFQDSKFGIFLHWGLYSMLAQGEWVMTNQNLDHMEYRKLASAFYPSRFDAAEWVAAIKAAGAKYILRPGIMRGFLCSIPGLRIITSSRRHLSAGMF